MSNTEKTLVIGCDHTARDMKDALAQLCRDKGIAVKDIGAHSDESCDYPLVAAEAARIVAKGVATCGILICGTGVGMSIAANKIKGIRCACCSEPYSAAMSRAHNDSNMLALGTRVVGLEMAKMIVNAWLDTDFEGERHARRVGQINELL